LSKTDRVNAKEQHYKHDIARSLLDGVIKYNYLYLVSHISLHPMQSLLPL